MVRADVLAWGPWRFDRIYVARNAGAGAQCGSLSRQFFEADAYARWADARLLTEAEWEHAVNNSDGLTQCFGERWQRTGSAYLGHPGFTAAAAGAVGEYNGKFMCNQFVLKGSSSATAFGHARVTYLNFFQPEKRWQFSGIRLAQ